MNEETVEKEESEAKKQLDELTQQILNLRLPPITAPTSPKRTAKKGGNGWTKNTHKKRKKRNKKRKYNSVTRVKRQLHKKPKGT